MIPLNKETKQALLAPFQASEVRIRTQPSVQPYVTARTVMGRLDETLPWQWSFSLGEHWYDDRGFLHQKGILTILGNEGILNFEDVGMAPADGKGQSKQSKHATSDCFKRCAVPVGPGRYLYELQGVNPQAIPESSLRKALAAVGYSGAIEPCHWGKIGGIRHLDREDEDADEEHRPDGLHSESVPSGSAAPRSAWPTDEDQRALRAAIEAGGGNPESPSFQNWLGAHTANHTKSLDYVLAEDVASLIEQLNALAERKKA